MSRKPQRHLEHAHQCAVIQWAGMMEAKYPEIRFLFCVPNGLLGALTPAQRGRAKAEGYKAGPPDLFLPLVIPRECAGLWIEMKSPERRNEKSGGLSEAQLAFRVHLLAEGYEHHVCFDSQEAIDVLTEYLGRYRVARRRDVPRKTNRGGKEDGRLGV